MRYLLTDHAFKRSEERGISIKEINDAVTKGKEYKSKLYGGQLRYYHGGVCVVVRKNTNKILTTYRLKHY
ncbi:hypothetical protein CRP7_gp05 [Roseobacter phage CRP-7]|jgi:hypothetical protein|nr:hypothetical protein CRP7_gp05 [Roseobacter phage CRP-7]